jgi:hypothetical protein
MSKSHNDPTAHEKEIGPGIYARFPLAGVPLYRQRLERLITNNLVVADITIADVREFRQRREAEDYQIAEEERKRFEERREQQALSRGHRRQALRRRYLRVSG